MADPWNFAGESVPLRTPGGLVTLVQGSAFCLSRTSGDIAEGTPQGLFFRDVRILSSFALLVGGEPLEPLSVASQDPFRATFLARERPSEPSGDRDLLVFRHRYIGRGLREDVVVRNVSGAPVTTRLDWVVAADFADVFDVKEGRATPAGPDPLAIEGGLAFATETRAVTVRFCHDGGAGVDVTIAPGEEWRGCVEVMAEINGRSIEPRFRCNEEVERAAPEERLRQWREKAPVARSDSRALDDAVARSVEDLGALRIFDPEFPERAVVAAGVPWFMTLFGRDSLLTGWMALLADPTLAVGVVQTLARFQGRDVDDVTEEQPGRILHEMRFGDAVDLSLGGGSVYYGSVDATPLFVMLLSELRRWGLAADVFDGLWPHAEAALAWIEGFGDRDGDGYVEYLRSSPRGLTHQGWKDSQDPICFADGRLAEPPIALCEVQGYVYAAYVAAAHVAAESGDEDGARRHRERAAALKRAFNDDFWMEERGTFALGLDADKRRIDAVASNVGHCLWTGIVDEDKAVSVARHLVGGDLFSGWGIRTLAKSMGAYNPTSYHRGSVWPHDNALAAAGLMRYGFVEEAHQVIEALLVASASQHGSLPELFTGLDRSEFPTIVPYPTSCSPQAWSSASSLLFLRTMLRLDPAIPHRQVWLAPALPRSVGRLRVDGIPLAGSRVSVDVAADGAVTVQGLPSNIEVVQEPRNPLVELR